MDALERTLEQKVRAEGGAPPRGGAGRTQRPGFSVLPAAPGTGLDLMSICLLSLWKIQCNARPETVPLLAFPGIAVCSDVYCCFSFLVNIHLSHIYQVSTVCQAEYLTPHPACFTGEGMG